MTDWADIIYRVNDQDEIVFVNQEWDRFAAANAGEAVMSSRVLRRPLWDFIVDSTTQELYGQILKRVRGGRSLRFTFRCDSPRSRRLLAMEVGRAQDGTVAFCTRTLSEEPRQPPALLAPSAARSNELLRVCAWCEKVSVGGSWVEVEEAVARLRLFESSLLPLMTHGICEQCRQNMAEILAKS